jgi:hypothetical protein
MFIVAVSAKGVTMIRRGYNECLLWRQDMDYILGLSFYCEFAPASLGQSSSFRITTHYFGFVSGGSRYADQVLARKRGIWALVATLYRCNYSDDLS